MHRQSTSEQQGLSLLEVLISVAIAGLLIAAISGMIGAALNTERGTRVQNDTLQQARFAMQSMVNAVSKSRQLLLPLGENPATAWSESQRNVLAVTLDPTLDRDKDGWADANNDKDFLDVNINSSRDVGEPERIDEDVDNDNTNDGKSGIIFIDDNGDGNIDNSGNQDDEEDGGNNEDPSGDVNNDGNADDDNDGATDEDLKNDMNDDGKAGTKGVDDDLDGAIDEGGNQDDDEDGTSNEDWFDPVVYILNGTTLMERMPNINPADGNGFTEYPIADNVSQFLVKRVTGGDGATVLVDITLTMSPPTADPVTLATRIAISSGL